MNPIVLLILMMLMAADALGSAEPLTSGWRMPATVVGAFVLLVGVNGLLVGALARRMDRSPERAIGASDRARAISEIARWLTLPMFGVALFGLGWLGWLRSTFGGVAPVIIAPLPPLIAVAATWWWWYSIDTRLRRAALVRELDTTGPAPAEWSRTRFAVWHVRHQMAMFLVLVGAIVVWGELIDRLLPPSDTDAWVTDALTAAGGLGALLLAPVIVRLVWDTERLADGLLRDRLVGMCNEHGVRVRDLLVWRTHGGMINAAVIGFFGRLRYIIVTDGMIERLDDDSIEAIMAHELGHIRRRHLPWVLVCAIAILLGLTVIVDTAVWGAATAAGADLQAWSDEAMVGLEVGALAFVVVGWVALFGVVSRQMERQADTFAAQHLASRRVESQHEPGVIGPVAASIVAETLRRVAALNHIPARRRAWRHGSIASRAAYLDALVGTPIDACPIDRRVRRTCLACFLLLVAVITVMTLPESIATI